MRIHLLPMGARFRHEGVEYVKTGPMFGSNGDGKKMFPRYVELESLDDIPPPPPVSETVRRAAVLAAFESFYTQCRRWAGPENVGVLDKARQDFLRAIE